MFSFVRGIFLLCLLVSHSSLLIGVKGFPTQTCSAGEGLLPFMQVQGWMPEQGAERRIN